MKSEISTHWHETSQIYINQNEGEKWKNKWGKQNPNEEKKVFSLFLNDGVREDLLLTESWISWQTGVNHGR